MFHEITALVLFTLFAAIGLVLTILGIGGTFAIVLGALIYNLISWSWTISQATVLWLIGLAILGELLEWLITLSSAKKQGASHYGTAGIILGGMLGATLLSAIPIIGTVIGLVLGAIVGAFLGEYLNTHNTKKAWRAARGALQGRALVSLCKTGLAIIQIILVIGQFI